MASEIERPTQDGYYWYKPIEAHLGGFPRVVEVLDDGKQVYLGGPDCLEIENFKGRWYGPIEPPECFN